MEFAGFELPVWIIPAGAGILCLVGFWNVTKDHDRGSAEPEQGMVARCRPGQGRNHAQSWLGRHGKVTAPGALPGLV